MAVGSTDRDRVRWAVVGTSEFAAEWIAPAIVAAPRADLVAIVSRDASRAAALATRLGAPMTATSIDALDLDRVDAVHLVVPTEMHAELTIRALELGLHVLVEKPMAVDAGEARSMASAAVQRSRMLAVGHCMAWSPPVVAAIEQIERGHIGRPVSLSISASFDSPPSGAWRQSLPASQGGGPWSDLGTHAVDAATRLFGRVASVSALMGHLIHPYPAEDIVSALLRFESGAHGVVQTTFVCGQNDLYVQGTDGRLMGGAWIGREFAGDLAWRSRDDGVGRFGHAGPEWRQIPLPTVNVFRSEIDEVSAAILDGTPHRIGPDAAVHVMEVLDAALAAAAAERAITIVSTGSATDGS
jgi:predicted dehydrogenase